MKFLVWLMAAINLWFGARAALNVVGILQTSKYATGTTALFAVLCLGLGTWSVYLILTGGSLRQALLVGVAPWAVGIVVLFLTMILSNPR